MNDEEPKSETITIVRCAIYSLSRTERGVEACMDAVAAHSGWVIREEHIYRDLADLDPIALQTLLNDAARQPRPFDLVLTESTPDLGEPIRCDQVLSALEAHGIPVFFVALGQDSRDPSVRLTLAFCRSLVDSTYTVSEELTRQAQEQQTALPGMCVDLAILGFSPKIRTTAIFDIHHNRK